MDVCPAFIDETGVLHASVPQQPVYGIGLLIVHEPQRVTENFYRLHFGFTSERMTRRHELRRAIKAGEVTPSLDQLSDLLWKSRHHEYKFTDVSRHNLQHYVDLVDAFFALPGLEFHALLIDRTDPVFNSNSWKTDVWKAYTNLTRELLKRRLKRKVFAIVDLQGEPKDSEVHLEDVLCSIDNVSGCIRATSEMSVFLQIVDVLLGCAQYDFRDYKAGYPAPSNRGRAKRQLTSFVKARIGLQSHEPMVTESLR